MAEAERLEVKSKATLVLAELLFDDKIHLQVHFLILLCALDNNDLYVHVNIVIFRFS